MFPMTARTNSRPPTRIPLLASTPAKSVMMIPTGAESCLMYSAASAGLRSKARTPAFQSASMSRSCVRVHCGHAVTPAVAASCAPGMETQVSGVSSSSRDIHAAPSHPGGSGSIPEAHAVISRDAKRMVRQRMLFMGSMTALIGIIKLKYKKERLCPNRGQKC